MAEYSAEALPLQPVSPAPEPLPTSIDKALDVCEVLSGAPNGMSVTELARAMEQPRPTVHRLLAVLKRRGYVRQDDETQRYSLTLKMLDLSFRLLGRSELRLHAYPVFREYVLRSEAAGFHRDPGRRRGDLRLEDGSRRGRRCARCTGGDAGALLGLFRRGAARAA